MIKKMRGFILLTTLILFSVLSIFVMSVMHTVVLYSAMSGQLLSKHAAFNALEQALDVIVSRQAFVNNNACEQGCQLTFHDALYHYSVNDEGVFPCLQLRSGSFFFSSHHWTVLIYLVDAPLDKLVVRVATREPEMLCSEKKARFISEGFLSWRYA